MPLGPGGGGSFGGARRGAPTAPAPGSPSPPAAPLPGAPGTGERTTTGGCANPVPRQPPNEDQRRRHALGDCPPGSTPAPGGMGCCAGGRGGGGGGLPLPGLGGLPMGPGGGVPGGVERPALQPIRPTAEYDPKIAESLAKQAGYGEMVKEGTGFAQDVLSQRQADVLESQIAQARQEAEQQGIPFNEAAFRAQAMQSINKTMADVTLGREEMYGKALEAEAGTAGVQAGERNERLGIDLRAQAETMQDVLERYRGDIQKYGYDVQAATAANNALLAFYSQLMSGMFGMFGGSASLDMGSTYYG